jgi:hypothetical protein
MTGAATRQAFWRLRRQEPEPKSKVNPAPKRKSTGSDQGQDGHTARPTLRARTAGPGSRVTGYARPGATGARRVTASRSTSSGGNPRLRKEREVTPSFGGSLPDTSRTQRVGSRGRRGAPPLRGGVRRRREGAAGAPGSAGGAAAGGRSSLTREGAPYARSEGPAGPGGVVPRGTEARGSRTPPSPRFQPEGPPDVPHMSEGPASVRAVVEQLPRA